MDAAPVAHDELADERAADAGLGEHAARGEQVVGRDHHLVVAEQREAFPCPAEHVAGETARVERRQMRDVWRIDRHALAEDAEVEKEVADSAVGAARTASTSAGGADPKFEKEMKTRLESMDKLDLHRLQEMGVVDLLNNDEQKTLIEERCSPITLSEYVMNGFVRQRVPIVPGVFEVTFQSMSLEDELTLKNLIAKEANALELSDRYLVDKYGYMGLAVGLHMIHSEGKDKPFPSHLNNEGVFDEKLFWEKFRRVLRLPFHLAASLAINFFWFEVRVRRLPRASKSAGVA